MIQPSDLRLLRGLRANARRLTNAPTPAEAGEIAETITGLVAELIKRQQAELFAGLYQRARTLAEEVGLAEPEADPADPRAALLDLMPAFTPMVERLAKDAQGRVLLDAIVALEAELAAAWKDEVEPAPMPALAVTPDGLQAWLRETMPGGASLTVEAIRKLSGGYSKTTLLFDTNDPVQGAQSYVLRAEKPAVPFFMDGSSVDAEFHALRYVHRHGVPVAEPMLLEADPARFGARFLVSRRAAGRNYGAVLGAAAQIDEAVVRELVGVLARIHATPLDRADPDFRKSHLARWARYETLTDFAPAFVDYWAGLAERCGALASPGVARGLDWLRANPPRSDAKPVLVHGDFGLHNVMIEDGKISAVLDWEASHVGDPADEFFLFAQVMSPFVDRDTLMRLYWEAGGQPIDAYRLRWFDVINCLKGPIVGYGSLMLAEKNPGSDERTCMVGYQFIAPLLSYLPMCIAAAEAVRPR